MDDIIKITNDIKAGNIKPIYFFMGEEPYYIDKLADFIENNVLQDHEKDFNQTILYGRDISIEDIVSAAKRYPMMADKQVIIVREAQELSRTIENLVAYTENMQESTVLVICYKYKSINKAKKLYKNIVKKGLVYESKKLYENQVGAWITKLLQGKKIAIEPKANQMLVDFLGSDLSRIANEIDKLSIILKPGETINPAIIEENIGFSKDFNPFEFRAAIAQRNELMAYKIANYFANNEKENPFVLTIGLLFSYFSQVLQFHGLKDKNPSNVASVLRINPYFVKDYELAARNYPMKKVSGIINTIRIIDLKSKGVGASNLPKSDLYKELLIHVFSR